MKKIFHLLHLWISIPSGIIISFLCLTGAMLVFETELNELFLPSKFLSEKIAEEPLPMEVLMERVQQQLPDSVKLSGVTVPSKSNRNYRMGVVGQGRTSILVNPYTGEVTGKVNPYAKTGFFPIMRRGHRWLLMPFKRGEFSWGRTITGTTTILFVVILITGIVIWIPRSIKQLKTRLSIKTNGSGYRFWYDTHVAGGMYVLILLLVMSVTALVFSFDWYRKGFYKVFGIELAEIPQNTVVKQQPTPKASSERRGGRAHAEVDYAIWNSVIAQLKDATPTYKTISIQNGTASVSINRSGNIRAADRYTFNAQTGEITDVEYYKNQTKEAKMRGWVYSVHVGDWGGLTTRVLYFIASIAGGILPITGYYIYWRKLRTKRRKKRKLAIQ